MVYWVAGDFWGGEETAAVCGFAEVYPGFGLVWFGERLTM